MRCMIVMLVVLFTTMNAGAHLGASAADMVRLFGEHTEEDPGKYGRPLRRYVRDKWTIWAQFQADKVIAIDYARHEKGKPSTPVPFSEKELSTLFDLNAGGQRWGSPTTDEGAVVAKVHEQNATLPINWTTADGKRTAYLWRGGSTVRFAIKLEFLPPPKTTP